MTDKQASNQNFIRTVSIAILLAGAVASLYFMFGAGRNQKSFFLIGCFTIWVLSPFLALLIAVLISKRWLIPARMTFLLLILFITVSSLVSYSGALNLFGAKPPAFKFLIVPLISWLLIATVIPISRKILDKK